MRAHQIKIHILQALKSGAPFAMPEETLRMQATIMVGQPKLLKSEFDTALRELESGSQIVGVPGQLSGGVKWKITDHGQAALAEAGV